MGAYRLTVKGDMSNIARAGLSHVSQVVYCLQNFAAVGVNDSNSQ